MHKKDSGWKKIKWRSVPGLFCAQLDLGRRKESQGTPRAFLGIIWRAEVLLCQNTKCRITQIQKYKLQKYKIQERERFTLHAACTSVLWENRIYWASEEESESNCKGIAAGPRVESASPHSRPCWSPSDLCIVQARTLSSGAFWKHVEYRFRWMWREQQRFPG